MAEERAKRKLSAILSGDVKGYSRLMGEGGSNTSVSELWIFSFPRIAYSAWHELYGRRLLRTRSRWLR